MPFYEREEMLLNLLSAEHITTVDELCEKLYISKPTVRRDLIKLSQKGLITRTHGGARLIKNTDDENVPFRLREQEQNHAKIIMAKKAVKYIKDGYTIMLDSSASAFAILPFLSEFKNLIVITNSAKASFVLGQMGIKNISTGGQMTNKSLSYIGEDAIKTLCNYNADIAFFSCRGISPEGYLTDDSIEENQIRKIMMKNSRKRILLCDTTKFDKIYLNNLCHISETDDVICDRTLLQKYTDMLKS